MEDKREGEEMRRRGREEEKGKKGGEGKEKRRRGREKQKKEMGGGKKWRGRTEDEKEKKGERKIMVRRGEKRKGKW